MEYDGSLISIEFNYTYLQQVVNDVPSEKFQLQLRDSNSQAMIVPAEEDSVSSSWVVMPVRLPDTVAAAA